MGRFLKRFSKKISAIDKTYKRPLYQTYLTASEWRNVEMSEEFAGFLKENKPFYQYPFFTQIYIFWQVLFQSYAAARKKHGHLELIFSEYMLMNLFIGISTTIEFFAKGVASLFLWPFLPKENNTEFQSHLGTIFQDYAGFIHHTPFYNYSYFSKLSQLYAHYANSKNKSFADFISLIVVSIDFILHGVLSAPVAYWYNQEQNKAFETVDIIVKDTADDLIDETVFAELFKKKLALIDDVVIVSESQQPQLFIRHSTRPEKHNIYAYAHLRVPRYERFQETVEQLAAANIQVKEIVGQHRIQIKCLAKGDTQEQIKNHGTKLSQLPGVTKLYTYDNGINKGQTFFAFDVKTKHLKGTVEKINLMDGVRIKFMHDF